MAIDGLIVIVVIGVVIIGMAAFTPTAAQNTSYRCGATTSKNTPCKLKVKVLGSKCHHHAESGAQHATASPTASNANETTYRCGANTSKGTPCKIKVRSFGLKCHHHD